MDNRDHILYTAVQSKDYGATGAVAAYDMTVTMWIVTQEQYAIQQMYQMKI